MTPPYIPPLAANKINNLSLNWAKHLSLIFKDNFDRK
jgi:hypothetical protein